MTLRTYAHALREEETDLSFAEFGGPGRPYTAPEIEEASEEARNPPESLVGRQGEQAQLASKPWTIGLKARCATDSHPRLPHISRTANRQLCINLTHPVSRLLDRDRAGTMAKYMESQRNSADRSGGFQDRCLQPLGHLSA